MHFRRKWELDKFERSGIQDALGTIKGSLSEFYKVESFNIKEFETDSIQNHRYKDSSNA